MKPQRQLRAIGLVLVLVAVSGLAARAQRSGDALNPQFEQLVERYLKEVRGVGGRDPVDLSAQSFARQLDTRRRILNDLQAIDRKSLSFDQDIDYRFLESILKSDILWEERVKRWEQDPRDYLQTRGISYKLEVDPRPPAERAAELVEDLKLLQTRLANGKKNLSWYIPRWVELSNAMLDGTITSFDKGLPAFAERVPAQKTALLAENTKALAALRDFKTFLNNELPKKPMGDWKIGGRRVQHDARDEVHVRRRRTSTCGGSRGGCPASPGSPAYHDWGRKQFRIVERQLEVKAKQIDSTRTWLQIIRDMKEDHPAAEQLVFAHLEATRKTREWVIEKDLVTIPWTDDDAIMQAAPPTLWSEQWWGFGPGVPAGSKSRKAAWTIIPVGPRLAGGGGRGEPFREGLELHVRHRDPRGLPRPSPAAALRQREPAAAAGIREQLLEPGLVLLHRVGADPELRLLP